MEVEGDASDQPTGAGAPLLMWPVMGLDPIVSGLGWESGSPQECADYGRYDYGQFF